jgi:hypothetical protein
VLQPQLTRRSHVEALVCRQSELLPEAAAAQLRQRFGAGVAAVYLLGDLIVPLAISEVMKSATDAACKSKEVLPLRRVFVPVLCHMPGSEC